MSITEYKQAIQVDGIDILKNPKTDKWFAVTSKGNTLRVHQGTDWSKKPKGVLALVEDGDLQEACLIPSGLGATVVASY